VLGGAIIVAAVAARTFATERGRADPNRTAIPADI
jgi:hypothetical protein